MSLSPAELARYDRHLLLPEIGIAGQEKLKAARVLIVGAGGLGAPAALYLAAAGVGTLGLADGDTVEASNLHRQILFQTEDIGRPKAEVAAARLRGVNPEIEVQSHAVRLNASNVLDIAADYDLLVDGSDRLETRYLLNDSCVILKKPLVSAAIHRFDGQAMTYIPDIGPCYRCLFPKASDEAVPNCAQAGVLGVLPGVLGSPTFPKPAQTRPILTSQVRESLTGGWAGFSNLGSRGHPESEAGPGVPKSGSWVWPVLSPGPARGGRDLGMAQPPGDAGVGPGESGRVGRSGRAGSWPGASLPVDCLN